MKNVYDMIVIGGGPGGYTAALYAARAGLQTVLIERMTPGGQMALTHQIDNYPGFENGIDGFELGDKMRRGAERFGVQTVMAEVQSVELRADIKSVQTDASVFFAKTVVLSTGANPRKLGLAMEQELTGRGVSYCAACDGMFYRGKTVVVVGGGNSAVADALTLSRLAKKVYIVHRRDTLRATKIYHEQLEKAENVEFIWNSAVQEILHSDTVTGVAVGNLQTGQIQKIDADGLFISIGRAPASELFRGQVALDESGYVVAGESTQTNLPGVYAVGDLRTKQVRQIVTAVADGAVAVHMAEEFLVKP